MRIHASQARHRRRRKCNRQAFSRHGHRQLGGRASRWKQSEAPSVRQVVQGEDHLHQHPRAGAEERRAPEALQRDDGRGAHRPLHGQQVPTATESSAYCGTDASGAWPEPLVLLRPRHGPHRRSPSQRRHPDGLARRQSQQRPVPPQDQQPHLAAEPGEGAHERAATKDGQTPIPLALRGPTG